MLRPGRKYNFIKFNLVKAWHFYLIFQKNVIFYCSVQEKCFISYSTYCISSICCPGGIGISFSALGAAFFLFFLSFSFQLSTLFFQIGFPYSSFNSARKTILWLSTSIFKEIELENVGWIFSYLPLSTVDTVLTCLAWIPASYIYNMQGEVISANLTNLTVSPNNTNNNLLSLKQSSYCSKKIRANYCLQGDSLPENYWAGQPLWLDFQKPWCHHYLLFYLWNVQKETKLGIFNIKGHMMKG